MEEGFKRTDSGQPILPPAHGSGEAVGGNERMKSLIKRLLSACDPVWLEAGRSLHNRWVFGRRYAPLQRRVREMVYPTGDIRVLDGPFQRMRYLDGVVWGSITPKWLGSYECELHGVVAEVIDRAPPTIVDVGCAEGFYAVGLAMRLPGTTVQAWDCDFLSRRQTRRLARLNGVEERVKVGGWCRHEDLQRLAGQRVVLICDIEGGERELLDPVACPALRGMDVLVEIHEGRWPVRTADLLIERFQVSHGIQRIPGRLRSGWIRDRGSLTGRFPGLAEEWWVEATEEGRGGLQEWFWMKPRQGRER